MLRRALIPKLLQAQARGQVVELELTYLDDYERVLGKIEEVTKTDLRIEFEGRYQFDDIKRIRFLKRGTWIAVEKGER